MLNAALETWPFKSDVLLSTTANPKPSGPDAYGTLAYGGQRYSVALEVKTQPIDRVATLMAVRQQLQKWQHDDNGILITEYLSPELAQQCRALNLQFIDRAGNCFIKQPNLLLWHYGNPKPAQWVSKETSVSSLTKIVFILLAYPTTVTSSYREIARLAGVSLGTVSNAMAQLEKENWLKPESGLQPRRLVNKTELLQKWLDDYARTLYRKRKLTRFAQTTQNGIAIHSQNIQLKEFDAQWGAESAAALMTHYLKPAIHTLYVRGARDKLIKHWRLRPDDQGDIEIITPFWTPPPFWERSTSESVFGDCVPPLMVVADLMASNDVRNVETAKLIQEKFIDVDR